jgi:hypothetical protein
MWRIPSKSGGSPGKRGTPGHHKFLRALVATEIALPTLWVVLATAAGVPEPMSCQIEAPAPIQALLLRLRQ